MFKAPYFIYFSNLSRFEMKTLAETYAERLEMLINRYGQSKLAELINTHAILVRVLITALQNGDEIAAEQWAAAFKAVRKIENILGLEHGWFDQPVRDGEIINFPNFPSAPTDGNYFQLRILDTAKYVCEASDINRNSIRFIDLDKEWAASELGIKLDDIALVTVFGDNMFPTLHQNDLLLVDTSITKFLNDGVYLLYEPANRNIKVRRLQLVGAEMLIISDNDKYQTHVIEDYDSKLNIVGKVSRVFSLRHF